MLDRTNKEYAMSQNKEIPEKLKPIPLTKQLYFTILRSPSAPILFSKSLAIHVFKKLQASKHVAIMKEHFIIREIDGLYCMYDKNWEETAAAHGIKLGNLKKVTWDEVSENAVASLSKIYPSFEQTISNFFFSKQEDASNVIDWIVYLVGHGARDIIADSTIEEFKTFTHFLQYKLRTKILICMSCYAASENKIKAFEEQDKKQFENDKNSIYQTTFSFPIVFFGTSNYGTQSAMKLDQSIDFDYLFAELSKESRSTPNYYAIFTTANFMSNNFNPLLNMPQIRLPNTQWFSIANLDKSLIEKDYVVISKTQSKTREKPLTISDNTKGIFIYSPTIPFPLIFKNNNLSLPKIIIMDKMRKLHIAEIDASELTFQQICYVFMPLGPVLSIMIYIDSLIFKLQEKRTQLKNCHLVLHKNPKPGSTGCVVTLSGYNAHAEKKIALEIEFSQNDLDKMLKEALLDHPYTAINPEEVYTPEIPAELLFKRFDIPFKSDRPSQDS